MRSALRELFQHTIRSLDVDAALERHARRIGALLSASSRVYVVAAGKAAVPMAQWYLRAYRADATVVAAPSCVALKPRTHVRCFDAGHPVPNGDSLRAGQAALDLVREADAADAVIFLISGGGSAMLASPLDPALTLADMEVVNAVLVTCGAGIAEMNAVRKHLSAVKGGRLAQAAAPASQLTLFISDVPDAQDGDVASGPTTPDQTTRTDALAVVSHYRLAGRLPAQVLRVLNDAALPETPKPGAACFARSQWVRLLGNADALNAARSFAGMRGWRVVIDEGSDDAPVATAAEHLLARVRDEFRHDRSRPVCVLAGGELSSPVRGDGVGGRNQAFVLECVARIAGEPITVMSAGTDGIDGNSPAAGAVADGWTLGRARAAGMDPVAFRDRSDAYHFFHRLGDDITCGATGMNVRDIRALVMLAR